MVHKIILLYLLLSAQNHAACQTTIEGSFLHGGIVRTYSYYVPATYNHSNAVPLVIRLHGFGSNGAEHARRGDFRPIADTANFIVAHPDGSVEKLTKKRFWNFGRVMGSSVDDVSFIQELIDTISARLSIDQSRIYAVGMSNGSFLCYQLACKSDRIAAIGCVTGSMGKKMFDECQPSRGVPVMQIYGTKDNINHHRGNLTIKSMEDVTNFWVEKNNCSKDPSVVHVTDINPEDGATAIHYRYASAEGGEPVEIIKVVGGGHTWPGFYNPKARGNTCMDFDATVEIWRFLRNHIRK